MFSNPIKKETFTMKNRGKMIPEIVLSRQEEMKFNAQMKELNSSSCRDSSTIIRWKEDYVYKCRCGSDVDLGIRE